MEYFCIIITNKLWCKSIFIKYQFFCFSSSSFSYYCTCIAGCCTDTSIKCRIDSTNRNACKKCRFIKYQNSWKYIFLLQILKYVHHSQEWYMLVKLWLNESFILFSLKLKSVIRKSKFKVKLNPIYYNYNEIWFLLNDLLMNELMFLSKQNRNYFPIQYHK